MRILASLSWMYELKTTNRTSNKRFHSTKTICVQANFTSCGITDLTTNFYGNVYACGYVTKPHMGLLRLA
eukprot:568868-Amorphochlora_amoeboformis.AAC.3